METYYLFYRIENIINRRYYLGMHKTKNPNDSYLGSGVNIKKAIKKYGRKNFNKVLCCMFSNYEDLKSYESQAITQDVLNDPLCYNIALGGGGSTNNGKKLSETHKEHIRQSNKGKKHVFVDKELLYKKVSEKLKGIERNSETKEKIRNTLIGHFVSEESKSKNRIKHLGKSPGNKGKHFDNQLKKYV